MPWIKIDDHFDEHPKHAAIGPVGWGVWLAGLAYCNRMLTDGFIPYAVAERIGGSWKVRVPADVPDESGTREVDRREMVWSIDIGSGMHGENITTEWVIDLLVLNDLWEEVQGGYQIHDYGDYQPSKAVVMEERRKAAERQQSHRQSRGMSQRESQRDNGAQSQRSHRPPVPVPVPSPVTVSTSDPEPRSTSETRPRLNDLLALFMELTGLPYGLPPHGKHAENLERWVAKDGWEAVEKAARQAAEDLGDYPEVGQLVFSMDAILHQPIRVSAKSAKVAADVRDEEVITDLRAKIAARNP